MGEREDDLEAVGREYVVGRAEYAAQPMARAKKIDEGFAKVLADPDDGTILGCHVFGESAADMIHHAVVAKRSGATVGDVADTIYVHPALSKVMKAAFEDARDAVAGH